MDHLYVKSVLNIHNHIASVALSFLESMPSLNDDAVDHILISHMQKWSKTLVVRCVGGLGLA